MEDGNDTISPRDNASAMSNFKHDDPFPLIGLNDYSYREAQLHAAAADLYLGLDTSKIEAELKNSVETLSHEVSSQKLWIGLEPKALLTPYIEIRQMLDRLNLSSGNTVIDFGAAYGRMGFVIEKHYPKVSFIGYEIVRERVTEGLRCLRLQGCHSAQLLCANIDSTDFVVPEAEAYFIYDFSHRDAIDRLIQKLQQIAKSRLVTVVARGRSTHDAIDHGAPWLSQVAPAEHYLNFSIYRSRAP